MGPSRWKSATDRHSSFGATTAQGRDQGNLTDRSFGSQQISVAISRESTGERKERQAKRIAGASLNWKSAGVRIPTRGGRDARPARPSLEIPTCAHPPAG